MSRIAERQVSFADWELVRQGLRLEPLLQAISDFLDDQKDIIEQVRCDLTRGLKKAETGRSGAPVASASIITLRLPPIITACRIASPAPKWLQAHDAVGRGAGVLWRARREVIE